MSPLAKLRLNPISIYLKCKQSGLRGAFLSHVKQTSRVHTAPFINRESLWMKAVDMDCCSFGFTTLGPSVFLQKKRAEKKEGKKAHLHQNVLLFYEQPLEWSYHLSSWIKCKFRHKVLRNLISRSLCVMQRKWDTRTVGLRRASGGPKNRVSCVLFPTFEMRLLKPVSLFLSNNV